jgi:hypothetical protein
MRMPPPAVPKDLETLDDATLSRVHGGYAPELFEQMQKAVEMGLSINSTWTGRHGNADNNRPNSHYDGRGFDSIGSQENLWKFFNHAKRNTQPHELIFRNQFIKNGRQIGGIGGHDTHVHFSI